MAASLPSVFSSVAFGLLQLGEGDLAVVQDGEEALDGVGRGRFHQLQLLLGGTAAERVELRHQAQILVLALVFLLLSLGEGLFGLGGFLLGLFDLLLQGFQFLRVHHLGILLFGIFLLFLCHGHVISCQTRPLRNPGKAAQR